MMDATDPKADLFLDGLARIIADLEMARAHDPEVVMLIGSLADRLCADAHKSDWPEVKESLSPDEHNSLVGTFSRQIEDSGNKGEIKTAYAMQAVAASLVGSRFADPRIGAGVELLDDFIAASRSFYLKNAPKPN